MPPEVALQRPRCALPECFLEDSRDLSFNSARDFRRRMLPEGSMLPALPVYFTVYPAAVETGAHRPLIVGALLGPLGFRRTPPGCCVGSKPVWLTAQRWHS